MKDRGSLTIMEALRRKDGKIAKQYAENYIKDWETSYSANTARVVKQVVDELSKETDLSRKVDLGSGPEILSHILDEETVNIELNEMHFKQNFAEKDNDNLVSTIDVLSFRNKSFDLAVASLSLDYLSDKKGRDIVKSERELGIREANRVLREGGYFIITFPYSEVDEKVARNLEKGLNKLGFQIVPEYTGMIESADSKVDFRVYLITNQKVKEPTEKSVSEELVLTKDVKGIYTMRKRGICEKFEFSQL